MTARGPSPDDINDFDDLLRRATELLVAQRTERRRLRPHEIRLITSVTRVLVGRARALVVQNQASIAALTAEIRLSFESLEKGDRDKELASVRTVLAPEANAGASILPPPSVADLDMTAELLASYGQLGETCRGVLTREGERWPADPAVWICTHRHPGPGSAEECAIAERDRRQSLRQASGTSDRRQRR
jgi:hypothetical protein